MYCAVNDTGVIMVLLCMPTSTGYNGSWARTRANISSLFSRSDMSDCGVSFALAICKGHTGPIVKFPLSRSVRDMYRTCILDMSGINSGNGHIICS